MNISEAAKNWTELGRQDPMWAILTADEKRGNKWSEEEFFATGRRDIKTILEIVQADGLPVNFGTALDFGCGLGRLSQGLALHFSHVHGVDVSQSMIDQARQHNKFGERVEYHLNVKTDLSLLPKNQFDFICSIIVLQHIPTRHQHLYIADFMELLKPGGAAYFQTIHALGLRALAPNWAVERYRRKKHSGKSYIPMYSIKSAVVKRIAEDHGCAVRQHIARGCGTDAPRFGSDSFVIVKPSGRR